MKAARWYGAKDIRIENIEEPKVRPGMVKVKVKYAGICGSDLHEYLVGPIFIPKDQEHPLSKEKAPVVLGHEYSGEVVEVGEGITHVKPGDKVAVEPIIACHVCSTCKQGKYNLCEMLGFHGLSGYGGGFSEYTVFHGEFVHKMPDNLTFEAGALVEPIAVAVHSVRRSKFKQGDSAIVFGSGPIGLATIQALVAAGAKDVIAVEIAEKRKQFAKNFGSTLVLDPTQVNVQGEVKKITGGKGLDFAFETVGIQTTLIDSIECIKPGGQVVVLSIWEEEIKINPNLLVIPEKEMIGTIGYRDIFPSTMELMATGRISTDGWVTSKIKLDDLVEKGFEELVKNKDNHVKILVEL